MILIRLSSVGLEIMNDDPGEVDVLYYDHVQVQISGLDIMNDDPSEVDVLYYDHVQVEFSGFRDHE